MIDYNCIQEGRMKEALISPKDCEIIMKKRNISILPYANHSKQKKNTAKGIWNRDILADFQSDKIVERCIFMCLAYYRPEQWKQNGYKDNDYQNLMQTPYEERFTDKGIENIYSTLVQWGMNSRGAILQEIDVFKNNLCSSKPLIDKLCDYSFPDYINDNRASIIAGIVGEIFKSLDITHNSRFVTLSKTLHFLHPQLMVPMDRTYTANYFHDYSFPDVPKGIKQSEWNYHFHKKLCEVYSVHKELIDGISKETRYPVTKLMDNMLIGFSMYRSQFINQFQPSFIKQ